MLKELDFGRAVDLQIFHQIDPFLLNEATEGLLELVVPEVILHNDGVLLGVGHQPCPTEQD